MSLLIYVNTESDGIGGIDEYTKLMVHMDGDESTIGHGLTHYGTPLLSSTQSKFGGGSMYFNGSTDYIEVAENASLDFGSGDFTIDFWIYHTVAIGTIENYVTYYGGTDKFSWIIRRDAAGKLQMLLSSDGSNWDFNQTTNESISSSAWHHVAFVRDGNTIRAFLDGTAMTISSPSYSNTISTAADLMQIGNGFGSAFYLPGYMDELRISKGISRWTTGFFRPRFAR